MGPRLLLLFAWLLASASMLLGAELERETLEAWNTYVALTEAGIDAELENENGFLVLDSLPPSERGRCEARLRGGKLCILERKTLSEES